MFVTWVIFHVLVCAALIIVVLLQSSKGEGLAGSAFGGGGLGGAVFGGRGAATFLSKATTYLAVLFMVNCIALAYMSAGTRQIATSGTDATGQPSSVITQKAQEERDRAMQQQQQQMADSSLNVDIIDQNVTPVQQDTSGGN